MYKITTFAISLLIACVAVIPVIEIHSRTVYKDENNKDRLTEKTRRWFGNCSEFTGDWFYPSFVCVEKFPNGTISRFANATAVYRDGRLYDLTKNETIIRMTGVIAKLQNKRALYKKFIRDLLKRPFTTPRYM
ncbi:uncharacterized protein LOC135839199 [Planococcus citri]|uniref:uncharacterized protein LOC135839199 n=1 Tax=Planococcus citri TaxID=170843 RepID=UPI0031F9F92A